MAGDRFLTIEGRPTVRVEREYPHPIEKVWQAVTVPEHLGQWFPSPVEIDLESGGNMRFIAWATGPQSAGTVEVVDAPRRLTFTWELDRLTFVLEANGDGTTFTLTHTFDDRYGAPSFATGWEMAWRGWARCSPTSRRGTSGHRSHRAPRGISRRVGTGPGLKRVWL